MVGADPQTTLTIRGQAVQRPLELSHECLE
jgi:hypothetical protein